MLFSSFFFHLLTAIGFGTRHSSSSSALCVSYTSVTTLHQLIVCLDAYTVPADYYTASTYDQAQPTAAQRVAWQDAISALLQVRSNEDCLSAALPSSLSGIYAISLFADSDGSSYCVLSETQSQDGYFIKGWGTFIVHASTTAAPRNLHLSAPHPAYDLYTPEQAAALFKAVNARSLLVAGRSRLSYRVLTDCINGGTAYYKTDPAHDNHQPFFDANRAIIAWQSANGGCPGASCAFIQMHGKGASTCKYDQIFLSSGIATASWYTDSVDRPVKRLKANLHRSFPSWNVSLPSDSTCVLTATKNIVGRLINNIPESEVCTRASTPRLATGSFVHIEQSAVSRNDSAYAAWADALKVTFP